MDHARAIAARAARQGAELVVAAGGDGTVHATVNGLMEIEPEPGGIDAGLLEKEDTEIRVVPRVLRVKPGPRGDRTLGDAEPEAR